MTFPGNFPLNSLGLCHSWLRDYVPAGGFCIDATAGRGRDTVFLCGLVGPSGRVVALDIQPQAVEAARELLAREGCTQAQVFVDDHAHLSAYAQPGSVDCVVFNFGWLPGGDHNIFTQAHSSVAAVAAGLDLLRGGGVMSLCIYYGRQNGYGERDALLDYLATLDDKRYTVLVSRFVNRSGDVPIPVMIFKESL